MSRFFGSSRLDGLVEEATQGAQEDWGRILVLCDEVSKGGKSACTEVIKAVVKRLKGRNPNQQMQTLTLLDACVSNCGRVFHLEVCSRNFAEAVKTLLSPRTGASTHERVAARLKGILVAWDASFQSDSQLRLIHNTISQLSAEGVVFPVPDGSGGGVAVGAVDAGGAMTRGGGGGGGSAAPAAAAAAAVAREEDELKRAIAESLAMS
eukprot:UC1_evm1s2031